MLSSWIRFKLQCVSSLSLSNIRLRFESVFSCVSSLASTIFWIWVRHLLKNLFNRFSSVSPNCSYWGVRFWMNEWILRRTQIDVKFRCGVWNEGVHKAYRGFSTWQVLRRREHKGGQEECSSHGIRRKRWFRAFHASFFFIIHFQHLTKGNNSFFVFSCRLRCHLPVVPVFPLQLSSPCHRIRDQTDFLKLSMDYAQNLRTS